MLARMPSRPHPPAQPHGELRELFPNVFFVTGTMRMPGPVPVRFSRNMTVIREGERLVVVNSVRLDAAGLKQLDKLGTVTDVLRLAAFHGMDDPFYKDRYGARSWTVKGQRYVSGFNYASGQAYHEADEEMHEASQLPLSGAKLLVIGSRPPEGLLWLEREGGVLVSGDCLQNWRAPDEFFSLLARPMMRVMGFIKPHNIGPVWLKRTRPPLGSLLGILEHDFEHVLPAHGEPAHGSAKASYRPRIESLRDRA
jgi:hypothetical protein